MLADDFSHLAEGISHLAEDLGQARTLTLVRGASDIPC